MLGTFFGVMLKSIIPALITFNGNLLSWWGKIATGALLLLFIGIQRIVVTYSARRKGGGGDILLKGTAALLPCAAGGWSRTFVYASTLRQLVLSIGALVSKPIYLLKFKIYAANAFLFT